MRRPLAYIGFSFLFSLMLTILTDIGFYVLLMVVGIIFVIATYVRKNRPVVALTITVIALSALTAQLYLAFFNHVIIDENSTPTGLHRLVGVVEYSDDTPYDTTTLHVNVTESDTLLKGSKISIIDAKNADIGDEISCEVLIAEAAVRDIESYTDGVFLSSVYQGGFKILSQGNGIDYFFLQIQHTLTEVLNKYMSPYTAGVAAAIVYGDRSGLEYGIQADFRTSGLSHILVVSGLHLSILYAIMLPILNKLIRRKKVVFILLILFVIFYTLLCGVKLSVLRAAFVVVMLSFSKIMSRHSDTYTSLGFAALVITLINPYSSIDLSLLLSLFATMGILFGNELYKPLKQKLKGISKPLEWVMSVTITSFCAIVGTVAIFAAIQGGFSILAIPANILAALLASPIIAVVLLGLVTSLFPLGFVSQLIFWIAEFLIELLLLVAKFISDIDWQFVSFSGRYPFILMTIGIIVGVVIFLNEKPRAAVLAGFAVVILGTVMYAAVDYNTLHLAIVGETLNPVIVITKNNEAAVIYRATKSNNEAVLDYLDSKNISKIDFVIDISNSESSLDLSAKNSYNFDETGHTSDFLTILDNVKIEFLAQSDSNICSIDAGGFNAVITSGECDLREYPPQTLVVGGSVSLININSVMLYARKPSVCSGFVEHAVLPYESNEFWIRENRSYVLV